MKKTSHNKGQDAENACCEYLKRQGLTLVQKNFRGHRGEIDIIMQDRQTLVFIEVRYRKNTLYGGGLESVTQKKQQRILLTAEEYLQSETKLKNGRIDVVAMSPKLQKNQIENGEVDYSFEWIKNAF